MVAIAEATAEVRLIVARKCSFSKTFIRFIIHVFKLNSLVNNVRYLGGGGGYGGGNSGSGWSGPPGTGGYGGSYAGTGGGGSSTDWWGN